MHPAPGSYVAIVWKELIAIISAVNLKELLCRMLRSYGSCLHALLLCTTFCSYWRHIIGLLMLSPSCTSMSAIPINLFWKQPSTIMNHGQSLKYYQALGVTASFRRTYQAGTPSMLRSLWNCNFSSLATHPTVCFMTQCHKTIKVYTLLAECIKVLRIY